MQPDLVNPTLFQGMNVACMGLSVWPQHVRPHSHPMRGNDAHAHTAWMRAGSRSTLHGRP